MELVEQRLHYIDLIHLYGELLSSTQQEILKDYFLFDLSLSEIAEARNVSRAAIEDALKKGIKKLEEYEEKLQINHKNKKVLSLLKEEKVNPEIIKKIEEEIK